MRRDELVAAVRTVAAGALFVTEHTVKTHVSNLLTKLGEQAARDVQRAEMLTTPVVLVLLLLIFGGLLAAGLPLLVALVGVGATLGILLGRRPVTTLVAASGVMVMLALPVFGMRLFEGDPRMLPASTASRRWR